MLSVAGDGLAGHPELIRTFGLTVGDVVVRPGVHTRWLSTSAIAVSSRDSMRSTL